MEFRKIEDKGGEVLVSKYYDGVHFAPNLPGKVEDHLKAVKHLKHKEGDVYFDTFPKCGTHWGYDILFMLQNGKAVYNTGMLPALDIATVDKIDALESPRVLVSHFYPHHMPQAMVDKQCKVVYIYRNPKDTAVSMQSFMKRIKVDNMKPYTGTWDNFFDLYMTTDLHYNSWFEHVKSWLNFKKKHPEVPVMFLSFEDMKQDLRGCVQKLAEFLGTNQDPVFLDDVASKCEFNAMSKAKSSDGEETSMSKDGSNPFFRKGEVGDWKNRFTVAQNEKFDKLLLEKMADIDLEIKYTL